MNIVRIRHAVIAFAALALPLVSLAQPYGTTYSGRTRVAVAGSFLTALQGLQVNLAAIESARLSSINGNISVAFPITGGAVDLGDTSGEFDHSGGLSLDGGGTTVYLTQFAIQLYPGEAPVITGLVAVNGKFAARMPLFDLSLSGAQVEHNDDSITVKNVALTLDPKAAGALSQAFGTTVPPLPVGTANVAAFLSGSAF